MTYSIGFRAPKTQELAHEFMHYLQDHLQLSGMYQDADLTLQAHPAEISAHMVRQVNQSLQAIQWDEAMVGGFLGQYLTEPKPHIVFEPPRKISLKLFTQRLAQTKLHLALASQMLFWQHTFFLNGDTLSAPTSITLCLTTLADQRYLDCSTLAPEQVSALAIALYDAYLAGYVLMQEELE